MALRFLKECYLQCLAAIPSAVMAFGWINILSSVNLNL